MNNKTHYETLGISKDADLKEIKKAFRELSMKTHPDVAKDKAQGDRFKFVSEAYRVLSNDRDRRLYDLEVQEATRFGGFRSRGPQDAGFGSGGPRARAASSNRGLHGVLDKVFQPRNIFLAMTLGVFSVFTARRYFDSDHHNQQQLKRLKGGKAMVEAWKNPKTGRWEPPAPWDPTYQRLKPKLEFVPRDQVNRFAR